MQDYLEDYVDSQYFLKKDKICYCIKKSKKLHKLAEYCIIPKSKPAI